MAAEGYRIMMAVFPDETGGANAVETLDEMAKEDVIEIIDAAVLVHEADGDVKVKQHSLPKVGKGAKVGAIIGGAIGLVFPPAVIGAALVGAGIGAGTAKIAELALKDDQLKDAAESLTPGTSAYIAVVEDKWVAQMSKALDGYEKLADHELDAGTAANLGIIEDDSGATAISASGHAVDPETGATVAGEYSAYVDPEAGYAEEAGSVAAVDPESGTVAAAAFESTTVVSSGEAIEAGDDDSDEDDDE